MQYDARDNAQYSMAASFKKFKKKKSAFSAEWEKLMGRSKAEDLLSTMDGNDEIDQLRFAFMGGKETRGTKVIGKESA